MVAGILVPQEQRGEVADDDDDEVAGLHEVASSTSGRSPARVPANKLWPKPVVEASYSNWFKFPARWVKKLKPVCRDRNDAAAHRRPPHFCSWLLRTKLAKTGAA